MGTETIKDLSLRLNWNRFLDVVYAKLAEAGIHDIAFTSFKNDGSYAKSTTGLCSGTFWVIATTEDRAWVELELKGIGKGEHRRSRSELYHCIKKLFLSSPSTKSLTLTWDEEDKAGGYRRDSGNDIRIKVYVRQPSGDRFSSTLADTFVDFVSTFKPLLSLCVDVASE